MCPIPHSTSSAANKRHFIIQSLTPTPLMTPTLWIFTAHYRYVLALGITILSSFALGSTPMMSHRSPPSPGCRWPLWKWSEASALTTKRTVTGQRANCLPPYKTSPVGGRGKGGPWSPRAVSLFMLRETQLSETVNPCPLRLCKVTVLALTLWTNILRESGFFSRLSIRDFRKMGYPFGVISFWKTEANGRWSKSNDN